MKRTIKFKRVEGESGNFSYRGERDYLLYTVMNNFNMVLGRKYTISITEKASGKFQFVTCDIFSHNYNICKDGQEMNGFICKDVFHRVFFTPDPEKRYDITVKKVKK